MFFFELLIPYVSLSISLYAFLSVLFSLIQTLIQDTQNKEDQEGDLFGNRKQSPKSFYNLRSLPRLLDRPLDPMVDLLLL